MSINGLKWNAPVSDTMQFSLANISGSTYKFIAGKNDFSSAFLERLVAAGKLEKSGARSLATGLFCEAISAINRYSQAMTHVVNFYLDDEQAEAREHISGLCHKPSASSTQMILSYIHEALRTSYPPIYSLPRH